MKKRSLILSTALLLVAIMACTSATYAWFTNNTTASVTTITASVDAASSLLISGAAAVPAVGSDAWKSTIGQADLETLNGTQLLDRSSVNASNFYSKSVNPATNEATFAASGDTGIITFKLHFISSAGGDLVVTNETFTSLLGATKAARVAMICDGTTIIWEPDNTAGTIVNDGYKTTAVDAINDVEGNTAAQMTTISEFTDADVLTHLDPSVAKTLTVKIWLEGQDAECANAITGDVAITTSFQFGLAA
ncbi:MAG: hypothetical protein IKT35_02565 [Clostridia bacterium]|nr:hypothetical protein [Clostridia bacterium]